MAEDTKDFGIFLFPLLGDSESTSSENKFSKLGNKIR